MQPPLRALRACTHLAILALMAACGGDSGSTGPGPGPGPGPQPGADVNTFLTSVSTWPTPPADEPETPTGTPTETRETVDSVAVIDANGAVTYDFNVEYVCRDTPYSIRQTPEQIVMFSPDRDILWAGSLLQGRSHREGSGAPGSLLSLPISERAPIQVSIPGLPTGDNFRTVDVVTQANVESAIGAIIGNAQAQNLFTPATDDFEVETYNSEREFALKTKLSGRYLRFSGSAGVDVNTRTSETTIAVRYIQRLYEVVVAPPQTPGAFFTTAFTQDRLQQQVDLGRLGPDNQPVYVSNIVYGRMMMFTMTAQASADELKAIVNASYDGLLSSASASLSLRQREILRSSRIAITTYGGDRNGTQAMIRSGNWREYFTQTVRLSDALPLSYTFKTLTGQTAGVSEATNYTIRTCQPLSSTPFEYQAVQRIGQPVPTPLTRQLADVNGDQRADLVLNHLSPTRNVTAVLLGQSAGTFGSPIITEATATPAGGWAQFELFLGDVNGNGRADLVWNRRGSNGNTTVVGLSSAAGTLTIGAEQRLGSATWNPAWRTLLADVDGDGDKDLVFNLLGAVMTGENQIVRVLSNGDGTFDFAGSRTLNHPARGWTREIAFAGDVDQDGDEDILWNNTGDTPNRFWHGIADTSRAFTFPGPSRDHPTTCCWSDYKRIAGDFDGDQRLDVALWTSNSVTRGLHRAYSTGPASFVFPPFASNNAWRTIIPNAPWEPYAGDVNGDGVDDVVINALGNSSNMVRVLIGTPNRIFPDPLFQPDHPVTIQWITAGARSMLIGDVTGDLRADLVWVVPGSNTEVYVARSR